MARDINRLALVRSGQAPKPSEQDAGGSMRRTLFLVAFFVTLFGTAAYILAMVLFMSSENAYLGRLRYFLDNMRALIVNLWQYLTS